MEELVCVVCVCVLALSYVITNNEKIYTHVQAQENKKLCGKIKVVPHGARERENKLCYAIFSTYSHV